VVAEWDGGEMGWWWNGMVVVEWVGDGVDQPSMPNAVRNGTCII